MSASKAKQIIGVVLLIAFLMSAGWKIYDNLRFRQDGDVIFFFIIIIFLLLAFGVYRIFKY